MKLRFQSPRFPSAIWASRVARKARNDHLGIMASLNPQPGQTMLAKMTFLASSTHCRTVFAISPSLFHRVEEAELIDHLERLPFQPFNFQGHLANRRVAGFGFRYDFEHRQLMEAPPIPDFLLPLRDKVAALAGLPADAFVQVLINEYRPGAGIGWHREAALPSGCGRFAVSSLQFSTAPKKRYEVAS